jgi:hypothetical protein
MESIADTINDPLLLIGEWASIGDTYRGCGPSLDIGEGRQEIHATTIGP